MSRENNKIKKYIPENILATLSYVDYEVFPYDINPISVPEMTRILSIFLRTGKSFEEIKSDLLDIAEGKPNELSDFVTSYPRNKKNSMTESFLMIFMGFFIAFGLLRGIILTL